MCSVINLTTTDIFCRTPPISPDYNVSSPQNIVLTNRLMADSTCNGSCSFSYNSQSQSPSLSSISVNSITSGIITLNGTNLALGNPIVILTNVNTSLSTEVVPNSASATSITFLLPKI